MPVLPMKFKNKLFFPLCKKCITEKNQNDCSHSDEERQLIGTWTSMEIQAANKKRL